MSGLFSVALAFRLYMQGLFADGVGVFLGVNDGSLVI